MKEVQGHPEFFLEWGRNMELYDQKTNEHHTTELYPVVHPSGMKMHFVYPWILGDVAARNRYKISLLEQERERGNEYYIKGTLNMAESCGVVLDFFKDRRIILTDREDREAMYMSFFFAWETKIFHARRNNLTRYRDKMSEGVTVPDQIVIDYIGFVRQYETIFDYVRHNDFDYRVLMYEQLDDPSTITDALGTSEWEKHRDDTFVPIQVEKDYRDLIHNYDHVLDLLRRNDAL